MPSLDQKFRRADVSHKLVLGKAATLVVTSSAGVESTLSPAELAKLDGVTASTAEINTLTGILATADELNRSSDLSTRIVSTTAATISVTLAAHDGKTVVLASTHTQTLTLPTAAGTGARYRFAVSATGTDGSKVIKVGSTLDNMAGVCIVNCTSTDAANGFLTTATDDTITLNNTTQGGIKGTVVEIEDVATNLYTVRVVNSMSGAIATPFSASV